MLKRRYEILLPLRYNDGRSIGDDKFDQTRAELVDRFDGISFQPQSIIGMCCMKESATKTRPSA